jgi:hypothetical protein
VAAAIAIGTLVPAFAQTPGGTSPTDAIPLSGTAFGSLPAGGTQWFSYTHVPTLNDEVILSTNSPVAITTGASGNNTGGVWVNSEFHGTPGVNNAPTGVFGAEVPGFIRTAQTGNYGLPIGLSYSELGKAGTVGEYFLEVVNATHDPVNFALTLNQLNTATSSTDAFHAPRAAGAA